MTNLPQQLNYEKLSEGPFRWDFTHHKQDFPQPAEEQWLVRSKIMAGHWACSHGPYSQRKLWGKKSQVEKISDPRNHCLDCGLVLSTSFRNLLCFSKNWNDESHSSIPFTSAAAYHVRIWPRKYKKGSIYLEQPSSRLSTRWRSE